MEHRHEEMLMARLEDVYLNGCTHITYTELYFWYDVKKIAAGTLRDLNDRWKKISGSSARLMQIEGKAGIFLYDASNARPVYKAA